MTLFVNKKNVAVQFLIIFISLPGFCQSIDTTCTVSDDIRRSYDEGNYYFLTRRRLFPQGGQHL